MAHRAYAAGRGRQPLLAAAVVLLACCWTGHASAASRPEILRIRHFSAPGHTRVVLDLTAPATYEVRRVGEPPRIAINVAGAAFAQTGPVDVGDGLVRRVRSNAGTRRAQVVLDLERSAEYRTFFLAATGGLADRIVIDVLRDAAAAEPEPEPGPVAEAPGRPFTVVVDAGHGGMDPGAIREGVREKDVVLDIARELARLIDGVPGYRAVLTRDGDYGLELWERVDIARREEGDLFLSVHANTHPRNSVAGMEVYFLSLQGATDREARELADRENAAALVGLDPAAGGDDLVMEILMDLRMTAMLRESGRLADCLLDAADRSGHVEARRAKQAGFHVLRSLAMPSALVEVAYLSHSGDRRLLADPAQRRALAATLAEGVLSWRRDAAAVASLGGRLADPWTRHYRVRRGDSLWKLARRHGTTVTEISRHNDLPTRGIMVGQVLRLPEVVRVP